MFRKDKLLKRLKTYFLPLLFLVAVVVSFRGLILTDRIPGHNWDWVFPATDFLFKRLNIPSSYAWWDFNLGSVSTLKLSQFFPDSLLALLAHFLTPKWVVLTFFFFIMAVAFSTFKRFLDSIVKKSQLNYLPSFLYAFSPFLFNDIIGGSWYMWISYAFAPLFFLQLLAFIKDRKTQNLFFFLIAAIFVLVSLQDFVLIEIIIVSYLAYLVIFTKSFSWKQIFGGYFLSHLVLFIFNLYWLVPFLYSIANFQQIVFSSDFVINFEAVRNSYQGIRDTFSLTGYLDRNMYYYALPGFLVFLFTISVFLFWIMILSPLFHKKERIKNYHFWLLALLVSVIFIKGGNPPFSELTMWLYQNIFLMRLYRSPQHLMFITAFIVPILMAFSLNHYLPTKFKKFFTVIFSLLVFILVSGWWYNGDLGHAILGSQKRDFVDFYSLSPELETIYKMNEATQTTQRMLFLPTALSVTYQQTNFQERAQGGQPEYAYLKNATFNSGFNLFADKIENSFCSLSLNFNLANYLSLFSVREIILRDDIYPSFTQAKDCWDPQKTKAILDSNPNLTKFLENGHVTAYRLNDVYFIPLFYVPQRIIYTNQKVDFTSNDSILGEYLLRSAVYSNTPEINTSRQFKEGTDKVFVLSRPELVEAVGEKDILASKEVEYEYQTVKHVPNNFIWKLVLFKEKYLEWRASKNKDELLRLELMYANKRIAELEKFNVLNSNELLKVYSEKIQKALQLADENNDGEKKTIAYLKIQKTLNYNLQKLREIAAKNPAKKFPGWEEKIRNLLEDAKNESQANPLIVKYEFDVPQDGDYTLFLDDDQGLFRKPEMNLAKWKIKINGQEIKTQVEAKQDDGWISFGKISLQGRGGQKGSLSIDYSDLQPIQLEKDKHFTQIINGWYPDTRFYVAGSAQLATEDVRLAIDETLRGAEGKMSVNLAKEIMLFLNDSRFNFYVKSDERVVEARFNLSPWKEKEKFYKESKINEIKIFPLYTPKIILKLERTDLAEPKKLEEKPAEVAMAPKITFVKINPIKYRVRIEGAKDPYTLIFNQIFDKGWKLYYNKEQNSKGFGEIAGNYFGGEIQEGIQRMDFLDSTTFETLGKKTIADDRHYLVNDYANSWYIKPEDVNNQGNYELIVEFWPQRLFYFGLFLSGLMIFGLLVVIAYYKVRRLLN